MSKPWAIILLKFNDDDSEPLPRSRYEEIFTSSGAGNWSVVDYFRDMSHGRLDLSGNQVFGWYTLDKKTTDYKGSGKNPQGRNDLLTWARAKAVEEGVNLNDFFNIVVVLNYGWDLFGGLNGVVCGDDGLNKVLSGLSASALGQEMGHAYGLSHSRLEGSVDYTDPFDVMSVFNARMADHPVYTARTPRGEHVYPIGPGLNAANMHSVGWIDQHRVWDNSSFNHVRAMIELRPLHRADLPGFLVARLDDLYIEFRMNNRWDAKLSAPAVLIHRFVDGHSYLIPDDNGSQALGVGDGIETPSNLSVLGSHLAIKVTDIDTVNEVATIRVERTRAQLPQSFPKEGPFQTPWIKWSDLTPLGEAIVVVNGQALTIPRNSPLHGIAEGLAQIGSGSALLTGQTKEIVRREALWRIATLSQQELSSSEFFEPARPLMAETAKDVQHESS